MRLIGFELEKIWKKSRFILSVCALLAGNLFFLWYGNLSGDEAPPLSAYRALQQDLLVMTEQEKEAYITQWKEMVEGAAFVEDILRMQSQGETGERLAQQELDSHPGLFEQYYEIYETGEALRYTGNMVQEQALVDEVYGEMSKVYRYEEYLDDIRDKKESLSQVSIFQNSQTPFSRRNIEKSAGDYSKLADVSICWQFSGGIRTAGENRVTDCLLFLSVFLFLGELIGEEKQKKLFYITRTSQNGIFPHIVGKMAAMTICCFAVGAAMLGENLIYAEKTTGIGNLMVSLQSLAPYMESNLSLTVLEYLLLAWCIKAIVISIYGILLIWVSFLSDREFIPYLTGMGILGASAGCCWFLPEHSRMVCFKYLNFAGFMETEKLLGGYRNLNVGGWPASRLWMTVVLLLLLGLLVTGGCMIWFYKGTHLENRKGKRLARRRMRREHKSLLGFEAYKLLIMNRSLLVLIGCVILAGGYLFSQKYHLSVQEQYYQSLMAELEGELNDEKEERILSEEKRFAEASDRIGQIEQMEAQGELDERSADSMKLKWQAILTFYPAFQRAKAQYERCKEQEGCFVYDTGYAYLFGKMDSEPQIALLFLFLVVILAFYNSVSMEYTRKSWYVIGATRLGRRKILTTKGWICILCGAALVFLLWGLRAYAIGQTFSMTQWISSVRNLAFYSQLPWDVPIAAFLLWRILLDVGKMTVAVLCILLLSSCTKNEIQSLFFQLFLYVICILFYFVRK